MANATNEIGNPFFCIIRIQQGYTAEQIIQDIRKISRQDAVRWSYTINGASIVWHGMNLPQFEAVADAICDWLETIVKGKDCSNEIQRATT